MAAWGTGSTAIAYPSTASGREVLLAQSTGITGQSNRLTTSSTSSDALALANQNAANTLIAQTEDDANSDEVLENGITEPATDATTDAPDQPDSPNSGGLFRLALIGLAIVVFGGLGGTAMLLARRGSASSENLEEDADPSKMSPVEQRTVSAPYTRTTQNGSAPPAASASGLEQQALPVSPSELASSMPEVERSVLTTATASSPPTPRLAKVNIIDELIEDLDNANPGIRRKAIWELGQRGNSAAVQPLVGLIVNADSHEQCLILAALAEIGSRTLKPMNRALALSMQNENPEVRKNAIRDLTRIYDLMGQVGRVLGHAASDEDPDVRQTAHWALEQLNRMRFSATDSAGLLKEGKSSPPESLPESRTASADSFAQEDTRMEVFPGDETSPYSR